jgi:hypothetical protein
LNHLEERDLLLVLGLREEPFDHRAERHGLGMVASVVIAGEASVDSP